MERLKATFYDRQRQLNEAKTKMKEVTGTSSEVPQTDRKEGRSPFDEYNSDNINFVRGDEEDQSADISIDDHLEKLGDLDTLKIA